MDSCKTCCRDPVIMEPLTQLGIPVVIMEWSLTTNTQDPGEQKDPGFLDEFWRTQISAYANYNNSVTASIIRCLYAISCSASLWAYF